MEAMDNIVETKRGRFRFRLYREEDEQGVLLLWKAAFNKDMDPDIWRWKYEQSPYGRQIVVCEDAEESGRILAVYSGIPYKARWQGDTVALTQLMDIMSHPDYRGEGLFVRAAKYFFEIFGPPHGAVCLYGFPGGYHFKLGERILGYEALEGGVAFLAGSTEAVGKKGGAFAGRVLPMEDLESGVDELSVSLSEDYPFSVIRDSAFLRWRFLRHPWRKYEIWGYRSYLGGRLKGYAVLSVEEETARLVDALLPPGKKIFSGFLPRVAEELKSRGVERVETWLPARHFTAEFLRTLGFEALQEPLGIIPTVRILHESLSCEWISRNIFYTMADGDLL